MLADGRVAVTSKVGFPTHCFDDITRSVTIGRRGGLEGFRNVGHGKAGNTSTRRGPHKLYELNSDSVF
jgi:hypothetical protein